MGTPELEMKKSIISKSKLLRKLLNCLFYDPFKFARKVILFLGQKPGLCMLVPSKYFISLEYKEVLGKKLNLNNPQSFNEKIQWLKVYCHRPFFTQLVDKYEVRKYIEGVIGAEYLVPLLGVYNNFADINFAVLPDQFVLKPNHTSGNVFICDDKSKLDLAELERKTNMWLKRRYFWVHRETPYKNIKPKIICEKYMVDESGTELKDYKFMCFNGEPRIIQVMSQRKNNQYLVNHFDLEWNEINMPRKTIKANSRAPVKPDRLSEMIEISKILSKGIPFVRIDLYETATGVYFGEITFYPVSGFMDFADHQTDYLLGSWIKLSQ